MRGLELGVEPQRFAQLGLARGGVELRADLVETGTAQPCSDLADELGRASELGLDPVARGPSTWTRIDPCARTSSRPGLIALRDPP
jgi:hypothetical protein